MSSTISLAGGAGLRSRKIDNRKPLGVYRITDLPDLDDNANINRVAPSLTTGVEKEEEEEHHLQAALHGNHTGVAASQVFIPTPDATKEVSDYADYYDSKFQQPRSLIRFSSQIEDCIGFLYNVDDVDIKWLKDIKAKAEFPKGVSPELDVVNYEMVISNLERLANEKLTGDKPTLEEFLEFLEIESPEVLVLKEYFPFVYKWWEDRRYKQRGGKPIAPQLKMEELVPDNDPYVCFRRREQKQVRKTRRCDTASLEKLRRLRDEMSRAREILEHVASRERIRKELIEAEIQVFEARIKVRRMKKLLGIATTIHDVDASPEKKIKKQSRNSLGAAIPKIRIKANRYPDGGMPSSDIFSPSDPIPVEVRIARRRAADQREGWLDFTESPFVWNRHSHPGHQFWSKDLPISFQEGPTASRGAKTTPHTLSSPSSNPLGRGPVRRRVGRGGRIVFDRHMSRRQLFAERINVDSGDDDLKRREDQWRFDNSDEDVGEFFNELEENPRYTMYRAFNLAPNSEQECRSLMNKPHHPEQINILPYSQQQRQQIQQAAAQQAAPAIATPTTSTNKKRSRPSAADKSGSSVKKKQIVPLNPRDAAVKAMLQTSQERSNQQQQQQNQQQPQTQQQQQPFNSVPNTPRPNRPNISAGPRPPAADGKQNAISPPKPPFAPNGAVPIASSPLMPNQQHQAAAVRFFQQQQARGIPPPQGAAPGQFPFAMNQQLPMQYYGHPMYSAAMANAAAQQRRLAANGTQPPSPSSSMQGTAPGGSQGSNGGVSSTADSGSNDGKKGGNNNNSNNVKKGNNDTPMITQA